MRIAGITAHLPDRLISNDEILSLINHHSKDGFEGDLKKTLRIIERIFYKNGIKNRCWLENNVHPMSILKSKFDEALQQAKLEKHEIDLLIYTGVGRGFIEPANSCFVVNSLGLKCRNFDVLDACMGWVTSMDIVNDKMKAGNTVNAAIVNMELNMLFGGHIFPKNFKLKSPSELTYKLPSYTISDAITVTILTNEDPSNFRFSFRNRPDLADYCTIALPGWENYADSSEKLSAAIEAYQFLSYGEDMHTIGIGETVAVLNDLKPEANNAQLIFTHTSSKNQWNHSGKLAGLHEKIYHIAHNTGNLVTASIPAAICEAAASRALKRNDICIGWNGSAGMVFSSFLFKF